MMCADVMLADIARPGAMPRSNGLPGIVAGVLLARFQGIRTSVVTLSAGIV